MTNSMADDIRFSAAADKLHGCYPQKQTGLFMLRIKIPGGRISLPQWRIIAQAQKTFSPGTPVHLTTRQDIELHNLHPDDIIKVQRSLIDAGLLFYGSGGDALRNITVCSGCGLCAQSFDVFDISAAVEKFSQSLPASANLPRKFKISFSGCRENCARPYLNDIGFIAVSQNQFDVIVAGSLGPIPETGIKAYEKLPIENVFALCKAAIEMFSELGERENRRKARLRHLRQKLGDEIFLQQLDQRFRLALKSELPKINPLSQNNSQIKLQHRLNIPDGDITAQQILLLADICEANETESRINFEHGIELYGSSKIELPQVLRYFENEPLVIACQGARTCPYGLINTQDAASIIKKTLSINNSKIRVNVSGCFNNCAHSSVAAIGFVGMQRQGKPNAQVFIGGGEGKNAITAQKREIIEVEKITSETFKPEPSR